MEQLETIDTFGIGDVIKYLEDAEPGKVYITRKAWKNQFLYYMRGTELSTGLKYGYGEYENEPKFIDVLVLKQRIILLLLVGHQTK